MPRHRRQYAIEFKQEAVRLVKEQGLTPAQVARDLGLDRSIVRAWVGQADAGQLVDGKVRQASTPSLEPDFRTPRHMLADSPVSMCLGVRKSGLALCHLSCNQEHMAVGRSGRLVFEVEPAVMRALHARVAAEGHTLKDWLMEQIDSYLHQPRQESLPFGDAGQRAEAQDG